MTSCLATSSSPAKPGDPRKTERVEAGTIRVQPVHPSARVRTDSSKVLWASLHATALRQLLQTLSKSRLRNHEVLQQQPHR